MAPEAPSRPPAVEVISGDSPSPVQSRCFNFYKTNVGAGTKTVAVQWEMISPGTVNVWDRSLLVIYNIH